MQKLVRLLAAKWRELSARDSVNEQIVDETENNGGNIVLAPIQKILPVKSENQLLLQI